MFKVNFALMNKDQTKSDLSSNPIKGESNNFDAWQETTHNMSG